MFEEMAYKFPPFTFMVCKEDDHTMIADLHKYADAPWRMLSRQPGEGISLDALPRIIILDWKGAPELPGGRWYYFSVDWGMKKKSQ